MQKRLDKIDREILSVLQRDASVSAAQIGHQIGLSQPACYRRIQRLDEEGFIQKRVAILDPVCVGLGATVLLLVRLTAHGRSNLEHFSEAIKNMPNVLECFVILGQQDFFVKVAVKDIYDYERFFYQEISAIEGVAEVSSMVALSKIKNETALPIQYAQDA